MTTNTNTIELTRANRIAIQTTEAGFRADFYRTHKHLATMWQGETNWTADESANKSAQREDFRKYAIEHSADVGILWQPADLRSEENKRIPKYENDDMLKEDAVKLLFDDMWELTRDCGLGVEFFILTADLITPMTQTAKGTDLSKLGITEGKYNSTGNWAWAEVEMTLTLTKDGQEIYYTTTAQLVSGQLKKPHLTKTAFTESVKESLKEAGLWEEPTKEAKAEESTKADPVVHNGAVVAVEEVQEEAKPKTKKSRSKKTTTK